MYVLVRYWQQTWKWLQSFQFELNSVEIQHRNSWPQFCVIWEERAWLVIVDRWSQCLKMIVIHWKSMLSNVSWQVTSGGHVTSLRSMSGHARVPPNLSRLDNEFQIGELDSSITQPTFTYTPNKSNNTILDYWK